MRATCLTLGAVFAATILVADETADRDGAPTKLVQYVASHRDGRAMNSIDFGALKGDRSELPIGVFDSGIGGLTVLEAILKLDAFNNATLQPGADGVPDFAGEKFIYFGDQANMPYGNYPSKGKEAFLRELIVKDAVFLLGKRYHGAEGPRFDKPPVKAIVIACNTATAYGIEDIRSALKVWGLDMPVIGVVEAGARAVVEQLPSDGKPPTVGVLATVGTCSSNAYPKAIARMAGLAGKPVPLVVQQGSVGLAGAIEGNPAFVWRGEGTRPVEYAGPGVSNLHGDFGYLVPFPRLGQDDFREAKPGADRDAGLQLNSVAAYVSFDVSRLTFPPQRGVEEAPMRYVILGCTHFPLVENEISAAFRDAREFKNPKGEMPIARGLAEDVTFINPAEHTAKELFRELARARLRHKPVASRLVAPSASFFLSVANPAWGGVKLASDGSLEAAYKEGREVGHPEREDTKVIPMTPETLPPASGALTAKLPAVWHQLKTNSPGVE